MIGKSNSIVIQKLKQALAEAGVNKYKNIESTIVQVLSNSLGENNELTEKARTIQLGYVVPSAASCMNGLTTQIQYNNEQYKMYVDLLDEAENYLKMFTISDSANDEFKPEEMYNLLVSGDENAWENNSLIFDINRCIVEYTDQDLTDRFSALGNNEIIAIKKCPCIFAYENSCSKDASVGYITDIIVRPIGVKILFEKIYALPKEDLNQKEFELDIRKWELNRTHWAIKKVNLYKELQALGINLNMLKSNHLVDITNHYFKVSFTFPGEARNTVEAVERELEKIIDTNDIFYDNNFISQLAIPSLDILLQDIYRNRTKLIVVFLCEKYQEKEWCGIEFRAIREMIMEKEIGKIMFIRLDKGHVDGVFNTDGYIDGTKFTPQQLAEFINERLILLA